MKSKSLPDQAGPINLHDLLQPLNVIRLATGNIRNRILPQLADGDAAYLAEKLKRIDLQIDRATDLFARADNLAVDNSHIGS